MFIESNEYRGRGAVILNHILWTFSLPVCLIDFTISSIVCERRARVGASSGIELSEKVF